MKVSSLILCLLLTATILSTQLLAQPGAFYHTCISKKGKLVLGSGQEGLSDTVSGMTRTKARDILASPRFDLDMIIEKDAVCISGSPPATCCFSMVNKKIPNQLLQSYRRITNSRCPRKAVIFKTKRDKNICADPKDKWVQEAIRYLDQKSQTPRKA